MEKKIHSEIDNGENAFSIDDVVDWLLWILRYWYLFVISIIVFMSLAYLKNRKWKPIYSTAAQVIVEEKLSHNKTDVMQGFNIQSGYSNVKNQIVMFGSYDLVGRTIEKLPFEVDYYTKGRFKTTDMYKTSPIRVEAFDVNPDIWNNEISITLTKNNEFVLETQIDEEKRTAKGKFGEMKTFDNFFSGVIYYDGTLDREEMFFALRSQSSLVNDYFSRIKFNFVTEGSSVVQVSLNGTNYLKDMDFINALCEEFLEDGLNRKNEEANKTIKFIDEQLVIIEDSLKLSGQKIANFRQDNLIVNMNSYTGNLSSSFASKEDKKSALQLKETYLDYLTNYLNTGLEDEHIIMPSSLGINDNILTNQVTKYVDLVVKKNTLGEQNPLHRKYQQDIDVVKTSLLEIISNMQVSLKIEKDNLAREEKEVIQKIVALPEKEREMGDYERKYKINDSYYTFLLQKKSEAQILKASNSSDNVILEKARMLGVVNYKEKTDTLMKYLFLAILLPLIFVILRKLLKNTISNAKEIEKITHSTPIASIIHTDNTTDKILTQKYSRSYFAESFRNLKTNVEFEVMKKEHVSIMVTSTQQGEGKTYFSCNLAGIYALMGKKVLLLDLDLRKNSVAEYFGYHDKHGVSNYLIDDFGIDDYLIHNEEFNFDIMLSGTVPPNPNELMKGDRFRDMMQELKSRYDYIIIDTNPLGIVSDAYTVVEYVDIILYVVRKDYSLKRHFTTVVDNIKRNGINKVCYVMNDIEVGTPTHYYGYGYDRYRAYGDGYTSSKYYNDGDENLIQKKSWYKRLFHF